jgi:hypothetical protein
MLNLYQFNRKEARCQEIFYIILWNYGLCGTLKLTFILMLPEQFKVNKSPVVGVSTDRTHWSIVL